ncbi:cell division control protein Cdc6 [Mollisia scopiformis]|uniref:Cell division control protein n=1 Tax=Mollisia scopiformis TaxID=149040 RepID=A0A194XQ93_MOLSC|nr:cell division control protein Cdc6 [Mollisia scopiformis]KUJ22363.1 cell division control protein Cdc6 [Mollisia scopiformis]
MATSVLGKRTRSAALNLESAKSKPIAKRVKRQGRPEIFNDENENPFVGNFSRDTDHDGEPMHLDEGSESIFTIVVPVKHGVAEKHIVQNPTPQTPRHRDALSKNGTITPRHRVIVGGKPLTPRTPRTPSTPGASISTVYSKARQLFIRSSEPGKLVGREAEREELSSFIERGIEKTSGGCIYVSGPPGTGKSAMVNEVTETFEESATLRKEYINCMSMKTSKDLYGKLLETFCEGVDVLEGDELKALQAIFVPKKKTKSVYVVTLDEIDHVLSLDLEILYKLFEWSLQKSSHLVLIGIANALDLTDRFLPRLKARNLKPQLLPFLPYTVIQIKTVITTRLKSLLAADSPTPEYLPFLHPAAIELCSRKVASQTGDLRKAFDICRRAIDLIETETKQKHEAALQEQQLQDSPSKRPLEENNNLSSPISTPPRKMANKTLNQSLSTLTVETAPRALISHVNKITSATFGNGANQRLKALNLQQKAALCALVALEKKKREAMANVMATPSKSKTAAPTIKALYGVYSMLCTRDSILHPLTSTEFRDVVGSLETLSLISAVDGRNGSFISSTTSSKRGRKFGSGIGVGDEKRVGSCVGEKEVAQAVEGLGAGILKSILSGEGLDDMNY